ncbi:CAP-Gly domain-containing linker protein 2 isoform X4 [Bacillus rossius redtenbacheri]|uniref:CAP-Gly domain-containing linker protein 2 isoform X4 n=1 Tax=Bacillus rossius redtenbacheri TaxID=93214 RepID=UPI002FDCC732
MPVCSRPMDRRAPPGTAPSLRSLCAFADGAASSAVRKGSEDVPKKKSLEAVSSVEALWQHARRLSEAGVRRLSDASVILTEDTDSFIIGEKVWVGGSKPGQIAYIGETQFAPGDWAGVVLDEPVGKNDGSVAGVRYFQCEPRRGVFSRLTRLTRSPLSQSELAQRNDCMSSSVSSGVSSPTRRLTPALSPASSVKELHLKKMFTPATSQNVANPDLKLGERVIVMSSQGSKAGLLRYMGTTEFASGQWCGVELDDPLGKNDGTVEGVRYFECQPKFGLFAPLHKVSKSPSSRRPSCQLHHGPGSALKKTGSRESLTSMKSAASSVTGTRVRLGVTSLSKSLQRSVVRTPTSTTGTRTFQDALKEKEEYVAKLLKERELERAEVTRAASQAEEAEQKLAKFQKEFEEYKKACDGRIQDLQRMVEKLEMERRELSSQLEDEKRRIEDIQFRFEEESIIKTDLEVANAALVKQIQELEENLAEERRKSERLEQDSNKLFETEEALARTREDFETLRKELDSALSEMKVRSSTIDLDHQKSGEELTRLRQSFGELQAELKAKAEEADNSSKAHEIEISILRTEAQESENQLKQQLEKLTLQHLEEVQALKTNLDDLRRTQEISTQGVESTVKERDNEINSLKEQLGDSMKLLQLKSEELVQITESHKQSEVQLHKEISELKTSLEAKSAEIEKSLLEVQKKDGEISDLKLQLDEHKRLLEVKSEDLNKHISEVSNLESSSKERIEEVQKVLKEKTDDLARIREEHSSENKKYEETISEIQKQLEDEKARVISGQLEVENLKAEVTKISESLNQTFGKQLEEKDSQLQELKAKLSNVEGVLATVKHECANQKEALQKKEAEVLAEKEKTSTLSEKLNSSALANEKLIMEMENLRFEIGELQRKLQVSDEKVGRISQQKQKLEDDMSALMNSSTDSSTQLSKLSAELKEHVGHLDAVRERVPLAKQTAARLRHVLTQTRQQWEKSTQDVQLQMQQVASFVQKIHDESNSKEAERKLSEERFRREVQELKSGYEVTLSELQRELQGKIEEKVNLVSEWEQKHHLNETVIQDLKAQLNQASEQSLQKENELSTEIVSLRKKLEAVENDVKAKSELLVASEQDLRSKLEQLTDENKNILEQKNQEAELKIQSLQKEISVAKCSAENKDKELAIKCEEIASMQQEISNKEKYIKEADEKIKLANEEIMEFKKLKADLENVVKEQDQKLSELNTNVDELQNANTSLQRNMEAVQAELTEVNKQMKKLEEDKAHSEKQLSEQIMKVTELTKIIATVKDEKSSNETAVKEKDSKLLAIMEELETIRREKSESEKLVQEERSKMEDALAELAKLRKEKSETEKLVSERDGKIAAILQEVERLKHEIGRHQEEVKTQLERTKQEEEFAKEVRTKLESEKVRIDELEGKLHVTESERDELSKRCELLSLTSQNNTELTAELATLQKQLHDSKQSEHELKQKSEIEISNLKKALSDTKLLLSEKEISEKGKPVLEPLTQKTGVKSPNVQALGDSSKNGETLEKIAEEKDFAERQVNFLNSVIVDLQRKNEDLKARVEILEMGIPAVDVDAYNLNGLKSETIVPRLFCDICDMFDQHDTEDCPRQANESPPPQQRVKAKKKPAEERPYCEICEVFGHDTADCDDTETF